jgi:2-polyprenyl-3-methyl-5-hydroxy-6-metoxy-1,4-benzoquinol methylase
MTGGKPVKENLTYKTKDHQFRRNDPYASAKYDITTDWLHPFLSAGKVAANVGCGSGEYNQRLASYRVSVLASEPERGAFEIAQSASRTNPYIEVKCFGLKELADSTSPVDILVLHDVLEHIEDEPHAVQCISRLVKPGGHAVISVPAFNWLFGYHDMQLGHYRRYTKRCLVSLFQNDFDIIRARYYGSLFVPITFLFSCWLKKGYPIQAVTADNWKTKVVHLVCQLQRCLPEPIGTSVLVHLHKRN